MSRSFFHFVGVAFCWFWVLVFAEMVLGGGGVLLFVEPRVWLLWVEFLVFLVLGFWGLFDLVLGG